MDGIKIMGTKRFYEQGTVCRIRQWDDMAAEFGIDGFGGIMCDGIFTPEMKDLCGLRFTIKGVRRVTTGGYDMLSSFE